MCTWQSSVCRVLLKTERAEWSQDSRRRPSGEKSSESLCSSVSWNTLATRNCRMASSFNLIDISIKSGLYYEIVSQYNVTFEALATGKLMLLLPIKDLCK